jgi:hypothetical protein
MRSFAVLAFIAIVASAGLYVAQRPTLARGDVIAAELLKSNDKVLRALDCDPEVPLGIDGATFWCRAEFRLGAVKRLHFSLDRSGRIKQVGEKDAEPTAPTAPPAPIDPSDPWR